MHRNPFSHDLCPLALFPLTASPLLFLSRFYLSPASIRLTVILRLLLPFLLKVVDMIEGLLASVDASTEHTSEPKVSETARAFEMKHERGREQRER